MNKLLITASLILVLASSALPCGAPQYLFGVIHNGSMPVSRAIIRVYIGPVLIREMYTGPFGLFGTMVGACPEEHTVIVKHGRYEFLVSTFWTDGSGEPININPDSLPR